jgi:hypothetical protein
MNTRSAAAAVYIYAALSAYGILCVTAAHGFAHHMLWLGYGATAGAFLALLVILAVLRSLHRGMR